MSNAVQSALHPHPCRAVPGEQGPGVPRLPSSPFTLSPDREEPRMRWAWPKNHTVPGKPASQGPASRIPGACLEDPRAQGPTQGAGVKFRKIQEDSIPTNAPRSRSCGLLCPLQSHLAVSRAQTGPCGENPCRLLANSDRAEKRQAGTGPQSRAVAAPSAQPHPPPTGDSRGRIHPAPPKHRPLLCCNKHRAAGGEGEPGKSQQETQN